MFSRLTLQNFTAFSTADLRFSEGVNAYVGVNGSGKTHILKLLYSVQRHQLLAAIPGKAQLFSDVLYEVFLPDQVGRLVRREPGNLSASIQARWNGSKVESEFSRKAKSFDVPLTIRSAGSPIFIPAKDILGHTVNFADAWDARALGGAQWLDFDVTYRDLITWANPDVPRGPVPPEQAPLVEELRKVMTGRVIKSRTGRLYLKDSSGKIEFPLVAEGWRKIGLLWILIRTGALTKGTVLFWDEPEANLNPSLFPVVARILAILAKTGPQIHLASHSYAFLLELEHQCRETETAYKLFGLARSGREGVQVQEVERFTHLEPNPILDQYSRLYRFSLERTLKGE